MTITVFLGDVGEYLSDKAKEYDVSSTLITSSNYKALMHGTYYTSLGDLSDLTEFSAVLQQADVIYYSPPSRWSNTKIKKWTEDYLSIFSCDYEKKIINFNDKENTKRKKMLQLVDERKSEDTQVWVSGCSITHGVGVSNNERYGYLFANGLDLPVSFLTMPGSSVQWAANQILCSDIRPGDIVLWGITSPLRKTYWNEEAGEVEDSLISNFHRKEKNYIRKIIKKHYFLSEHAIYESIQSINSVENMMEKVGAKLIMGLLLSGMEKFLEPKENLLLLSKIYGRDLENLFLDIGTDGVHPGPITHGMYKEEFLRKYYQLYADSCPRP